MRDLEEKGDTFVLVVWVVEKISVRGETTWGRGWCRVASNVSFSFLMALTRTGIPKSPPPHYSTLHPSFQSLELSP